MPDRFEVEGKAIFELKLRVEFLVTGYGDTEAQAKRDALAETAEQLGTHGASALGSGTILGVDVTNRGEAIEGSWQVFTEGNEE